MSNARENQIKLSTIVDVRAYGAKGDGGTDDTAAIQAAINAAGQVFLPPGTYRITATLTLPAGTALCGSGPTSIITCANATISQIRMSGVTGSRVADLAITVTAAGAAANIAAIEITTGASHCMVERVAFSGMSWAGVWINASSDCRVLDCSFSGWQGTVQDSADVCIYNASARNLVRGNRLNGGGHHGALVQDPLTGNLPTDNLIEGNRIGQHAGYGVALYLPGSSGSGDTRNQVVNNTIEAIQGSVSTNRASGAGIYVAGNWSGGSQILGNQVRNCCVQTLERTLAPAGIGVNGVGANATPPLIAGNTVTAMTQGDGVLVVSSPGGAVVSDNVVQMPVANAGTGVGGGALTGSGIRVEVSSNVTVNGNRVTHAGAGNALLIFANNAAQSNISVHGGSYQSVTGAAVYALATGAGSTANLLVQGVLANNTGSTNYAFNLDTVVGGALVGNIGTAAAFEGLRLGAATQVRVSGGSYLNLGGTPSLVTSGTCTGTYVDESVYLGTSSAVVSNGGTGAVVRWRANAAPVSGTWAVGDGVEQSVSAVGSPRRWRCTVAGAPGTWVSEGNL